MILFFDTETTGKADFNSPPDDAHQPRLVQIGALLTSDSGTELASMNLVVQPEAFEIPISASNIHGITTANAVDFGVGMDLALDLFSQLGKKAHVLCAHNFNFDEFVLRGEYLRGSQESRCPFFDTDARFYCTMENSTDLCKLPGPYGFKWPRLQEAYLHAFGKEFDGAHSAMADVRACKDIYYWIKQTNERTSISKP